MEFQVLMQQRQTLGQLCYEHTHLLDDSNREKRQKHSRTWIVDIWTHHRDHCGKASSLGEVRDNLATFHARVVVLVDKQRFDHHENLVDERTDEIIQLVHDAIDHLCGSD